MPGVPSLLGGEVPFTENPPRSMAGGVERQRCCRGFPMRKGVPGTDSVGNGVSLAVLLPSCSRKALVAGINTAL